jgi:hypothetical protein
MARLRSRQQGSSGDLRVAIRLHAFAYTPYNVALMRKAGSHLGRLMTCLRTQGSGSGWLALVLAEWPDFHRNTAARHDVLKIRGKFPPPRPARTAQFCGGSGGGGGPNGLCHGRSVRIFLFLLTQTSKSNMNRSRGQPAVCTPASPATPASPISSFQRSRNLRPSSSRLRHRPW